MKYPVDPNAPVPLSEILQATARDLATEHPTAERGAAARMAMQAAFKQARPVPAPPQRRRPWGGALAWSGAATCAVVLMASTALLTLTPLSELDEAKALGRASDFVPLVSPERWAAYLDSTGADAPSGAAWVVPTELPGDRLAALGLPFDPSRAGENVRAELLLNPAGDVLAVRLVR